jgi:hypothetical protein
VRALQRQTYMAAARVSALRRDRIYRNCE